ncbi:MAG: hypothetical protein HPY58_12470 [Firmicutes bacterium]|nr:hypothetical protein [Bacillota bacterium]
MFFFKRLNGKRKIKWAGEARILGHPLGSLEARREIGFLPENFRYRDWLTARELLEFHGALRGLGVREVRRRIPEVLLLVGLSGVENRLEHTPWVPSGAPRFLASGWWFTPGATCWVAWRWRLIFLGAGMSKRFQRRGASRNFTPSGE